MSKEFCINPLIKIIVQSKALFTKALYCIAVPNTAFERQTLPQLNQRLNQSLYLPYNFSAGSKKSISTKKKIRFANRQFGIKA
ncbi:hypothetical protein [Sphingobacterium sp. ML3W]|uniref:hypothetical protein n=1 Tax=Sphingobacterium sp. ML3W TaxID=1538644 RepID=UPI0011867D5D|nr:hypothetical protein [Sphingobacterium sp. ML3W]